MKNKNTIPVEVVAEDKRLTGEMETAQEALAKQRWFWTICKDNPRRVGFTEYGRAVGRSDKTIARYAYGYATWVDDGGTAGGLTLTDAIQLATIGEEKRDTLITVATAAGVRPAEVAKSRNSEKFRSRIEAVSKARQEAVAKGGDPDEEGQRMAARVERGVQLAKEREARERASQSAAEINVGLALTNATQQLKRAARVLSDSTIELDEERMFLMTQKLDRCEYALSVVRLALTGSTGVDWDAALATLDTE